MQEVSGSIPLGSTTHTTQQRRLKNRFAPGVLKQSDIYFATTFDPRAAQATQSA